MWEDETAHEDVEEEMSKWVDRADRYNNGVFGFEVANWNSEEDNWSVVLPHQCGAWEIVGYATLEEAEAALIDFITEAQAALAAIREGRVPWDAEEAVE